MQTMLRVAAVLGAVVALAASATAPKQHHVEPRMAISATYDQTWAAVIDLFAERNWAILNMEKDSGLITTDWMTLGADGPGYADCGGAGITTVRDTAVRFNVRVREEGARTEVIVTATFRQVRVFDGQTSIKDCYSKGNVEALIHREVAARAPSIKPRQTTAVVAAPTPAPVPAAGPPRGFYCASSASAVAAGFCAREKADCVRARDAAISVIADITECGLVETAQCFDVKPGEPRCAPSAASCAAQRERAGVPAECRETP